MEKLADVLIVNKISKNEDKDVIIYGLSCGIEIIFNIITTIVLGFLFGIVVESLIFLLSFAFIRIYAGGYHCPKAIYCYLMSSALVTLVLVIVKMTPEEYVFILSIIFILISLPMLLKFAPVETPSKPLDKDERRRYYIKTVTNLFVECMVIFLLFYIGLQGFAFVVCLGVMVSTGLVLLQVGLCRLTV